MKIAITGASGFIGKAVSVYLSSRGWTVEPLSRQTLSLPQAELQEKLLGSDVILNLAGAPIIGRWTETYKEQIYDSRILTTRKLVAAIRGMVSPPEVLISGSAIGIYASAGSHTEEKNAVSDGFLGKICADWEGEAVKASGSCRVVLLRTGVVLGADGGALSKMLLPFRMGIGGRIASGKQGFSWIHLEDMVAAITFLIEHKENAGVFNLTAPESVDNAAFTRTLAAILHRPALFPIPAFAMRMLYGEGAVTVTEGQTVYPERLLKAGFVFRYANLKAALEQIVLK